MIRRGLTIVTWTFALLIVADGLFSLGQWP